MLTVLGAVRLRIVEVLILSSFAVGRKKKKIQDPNPSGASSVTAFDQSSHVPQRAQCLLIFQDQSVGQLQ
jgi:hypothetical protein